MNVPDVSVLVDARLLVREAVFRRRKRAERLVLHVDQVERFERRQLVSRNHRRDRVAHETHFVGREGVLVLADWQDAVRNRKVGAGENEMNARVRLRA